MPAKTLTDPVSFITLRCEMAGRLRYATLFSGLAASSVAWRPMGWKTVAYAEIEPFPCAHLAHHYPEVPNLGDVTQITEEQIASLGPLDVLTFGSPCQDFSVAGDRAGLEGARSGLFLDAVRIARWARKHCGLRFALLENVVGMLSVRKGRDFARVVGELAGLADVQVPPNGWGTEGVALGEQGLLEWAVLDAQWFGVAQRRRRVFALLDFGNWTRRPPILLEPEGLRGNSAPSRETGQDVAGTITRSLGRCSADEGERGTLVGIGPSVAGALQANGKAAGSVTQQDAESGMLVCEAFGGNNCSGAIDVAAAVNAKGGSGRMDFESETLIAQPVGFVQNSRSEVRLTGGDGQVTGALCVEPGVQQQQYVMAFQSSQSGVRVGPVHPTLDTHNGSRRHHGAIQQMRARRLTPRECERLQGQPDDYTLIPYNGKPAKDGPRYRALGNSAATTVLEWIGEQIEFALWCEEHL